MKKILSCLLVAVLLCSLCAAVFADNIVGGANAGSPEIVEAAQSDGSDGKDLIALTPYAEREKLSDAKREALEAAFESLDKAPKLAEINDELTAAVADQGVAVSDLFDISELEEGSAKLPMSIKLKDNNLGGFVALLQFVDGAWNWVDAKVEGDKLSFSADRLGDFAIIVTGEGGSAAGGATSYGFISSVANAGAPELAGASQSDGTDVKTQIVITPYDKKGTLSQANRNILVKAYKSLNKATDLTALNDELKAAAGSQGIAVSDLFYVSTAKGANVKYPVSIQMKDKNLDNFIALLHFVDGKWQWVDSEVEGDVLNFDADSLGAFATIVSVDEASSARTGDPVPYGFIIGAVVLAGAAAWFFVKSRKVKA